MNPRTDLESYDKKTARAFVEIFIRFGDLLEYPIDNRGESDEELRALILNDPHDYDEESVVSITGVDMVEEFKQLRNAVDEMGFNILEEEVTEKTHESIGDYTACQLVAVPQETDANWNKPTLVVYGSLNPEIEEVCRATFGNNCEIYNIRNHYAVRMNELDEKSKTELRDGIDRSSRFFEDDKRFYKSKASTSDFV